MEQGSGPGRERSPVEWGDFPSVRSSVHPSVLGGLEGLPARSEASNPTNWKTKVKQGKGTADHLMPLGDWLVVSVHLSVRPFVLPSLHWSVCNA